MYPKPYTEEMVRKFTLMDDEFMSPFFDGNIECAQKLVAAATDRDDIHVQEIKTQFTIANLHGGKGVRLDMHGVTDDGSEVIIEVENTEPGLNPRRPRMYAGMRDSSHPDPGKYGENLPQTIVIFICRHDPFKRGLSRYTIERRVDETGEAFDDGLTYIYLYIDGQQYSQQLSDILHDFKCSDYRDMRVRAFAEAMRRMKETEKEETNMSEFLRKYFEENEQELIQESERRGEIRGIALGEARGETRGEVKAFRLMQLLYRAGRAEDADRAMEDAEYRKTLYKELQIT